MESVCFTGYVNVHFWTYSAVAYKFCCELICHCPVSCPVDGGIRTGKSCPSITVCGSGLPERPVAVCPCLSRGQRSEGHLIRPYHLHYHSALISRVTNASAGFNPEPLSCINVNECILLHAAWNWCYFNGQLCSLWKVAYGNLKRAWKDAETIKIETKIKHRGFRLFFL